MEPAGTSSCLVVVSWCWNHKYLQCGLVASEFGLHIVGFLHWSSCKGCECKRKRVVRWEEGGGSGLFQHTVAIAGELLSAPLPLAYASLCCCRYSSISLLVSPSTLIAPVAVAPPDPPPPAPPPPAAVPAELIRLLLITSSPALDLSTHTRASVTNKALVTLCTCSTS